MKNFILYTTILFSSIIFAQTAEQPIGYGTSGDPYKIANLDNLYWLSQNSGEWDKVYEQTADIDASSTSGWNLGKGFSPIGNSTTKFTGTYDGKEFSIGSMTIAPSITVTYVGVFGDTEGATLSSINITDIDMSGDGDIGALAGSCRNSSIINCHSSGQVTSNRSSGGLIGYSSDGSTITNSSSSCNVSGLYRTGGLIGRTINIVVRNSYSSGNVKANESCGGLIGDLYDSEIYNCYSHSEVTRKSGSTNNQFGGFLGLSNRSIIENCYSTGKVVYDGTDNPINKGFLGNDNGNCTFQNNFWDIENSEQSSSSYGSATGKTTSEMKSIDTFTDESIGGLTTAWDFEYNPNDDDAEENLWDIDNKNQTINNGFPFLSWENGTDISMYLNLSGSGTEGDPYIISDINELEWLSMNSDYWDKHYKQTEDIDASETSDWNSGKGFSPIGDGDIEFTGSYDGQGFSINDLYISRTGVDYAGLFGYASGAEIKNITLNNIIITNDNSEWNGALGGRFDNTTVSNCHSSGSVDGNNSGSVGGLAGLCAINSEVINCSSSCTVVGGFIVGGLLGQLYDSNLSKSYAIGNVTAIKESSNGNSVGGLIGISNEGSSISICFSKSVVEGYSKVGGLVGWNYTNSAIENCYCTGNIYRTADENNTIAGFCGENTSSTIKNCYSIGTVEYRNDSNPTNKGFLGLNSNGTCENNFWDMETSGQNSNPAGGATGKTTDEMKIIATFTNENKNGLLTAWDFEENPCDDLGDENYWDTDSKNQSINSGYPFLSWENGETVTIDFTPSGSGTSSYPYLISEIYELQWLSENSDAWDKYFLQTGDIDASATSTWNSGAGFSPIGNDAIRFSGTYDGQNYEISNLTINVDLQYGGFFGYSDYATINNIKIVNINIIGSRSDFGALIGNCDDTNIDNCHSSGSLKSDNSSIRIGGLIGNFSSGSEITNSSSSCNVEGGNTYIGGFIGSSRGQKIKNCFSTGNTTGSETCGGFVGQNWSTDIYNCYSRGNVTREAGSTNTVFGGFIGYCYHSDVENCYSTGSVIYEGTTNSTDKGFLGYQYDYCSFENNFWDTETSDQTSNSEGGAIGKTTTEMKSLATFTDETTDGLTTAWDFETNPNDDEADENHWDMDRSGIINDGYPFLAWENGEGENDVSLPVELSSFTISQKGNIVVLKWTTASEVNNLGFNVFRSMNDENNFVQINDNLIEGAINSSSTNSYEFTDTEIISSLTYYYRLEDISLNGEKELHDIISIQTEHTENLAADSYSLGNAYPNPFNPTTNIQYSLPKDTFVNIIIYDNRGKVVQTLVNKKQSTGYYKITWDASRMSSGIYFYRISADGFSDVKKCLLLK